jgi:hypothetical protein
MILSAYLIILNPAHAGGVNTETHANNDLLNTFRTVILTNIHDPAVESLQIQDGIVDIVLDGEPFEAAAPPTGTTNFFLGATPSADSEANPSTLIINGNDGSFGSIWHSTHTAFPHFFTVDLGANGAKVIEKIIITKFTEKLSFGII